MRHGRSATIRQGAGRFVAHPRVNTTTAGIKPRHVLKAKVLLEARVHDLDSHLHKSPASGTNLCSGTAALANLVVVRQVNVKDQLALHRFEDSLGQRVVILGSV